MRALIVLLLALGAAACTTPEPRAILYASASPATEHKPETAPAAQPSPPMSDSEALTLYLELRARANELSLELPPKVMSAALSKRMDLLRDARAPLHQLKTSADPRSVVLGWHGDATLGWDLAQAIRACESPESLTPEQREVFREALNEKADKIEAHAGSSYRECAAFARACRGSEACLLPAELEHVVKECEARAAR